MTAFQLKQTWIALDAELTPKWKAPLINDSFAMIYFGRLQKFIQKHELSSNPNVQNDLLCGSQDIISVEPIHKSIALATEISQHPELKSIFLEHDAETVWEKIQDNPVQDKIQEYLNRFGDRCVGELKLETISFKQDPSLFIQTLQSFVRQNVTTEKTHTGMDVKLRKAAENDVFNALKGKPFKKYRLKKLIAKTRYFVSNRENLRYERTRVFGITRSIFSAIGQQFEKNGALQHERDIFYLTLDEVFNFIDGTAVQCDLKELVASRKKEFAHYRETPPPADRITTYGTVNYNNDFYHTEVAIPLDQNELKGQGCCPGIIKAQIRIVHHPGEIDSLNGDILVTTSTDPGWVTLFPTASAILVERGSLLSHSAIVSREMGIPCIVGVNQLLKTLKDGDWVEMNGSTGIIKLLEHES
jgi:pyruvate,water dikinase